MSRCCEGFENWQIAGYSNEEDYDVQFKRSELLHKLEQEENDIERKIEANQYQYGDDGYIPEIARNF